MTDPGGCCASTGPMRCTSSIIHNRLRRFRPRRGADGRGLARRRGLDARASRPRLFRRRRRSPAARRSVLPLAGALEARFLRLSLPGRSYLHLARVEVLGRGRAAAQGLPRRAARRFRRTAAGADERDDPRRAVRRRLPLRLGGSARVRPGRPRHPARGGDLRARLRRRACHRARGGPGALPPLRPDHRRRVGREETSSASSSSPRRRVARDRRGPAGGGGRGGLPAHPFQRAAGAGAAGGLRPRPARGRRGDSPACRGSALRPAPAGRAFRQQGDGLAARLRPRRAAPVRGAAGAGLRPGQGALPPSRGGAGRRLCRGRRGGTGPRPLPVGALRDRADVALRREIYAGASGFALAACQIAGTTRRRAGAASAPMRYGPCSCGRGLGPAPAEAAISDLQRAFAFWSAAFVHAGLFEAAERAASSRPQARSIRTTASTGSRRWARGWRRGRRRRPPPRSRR